MESTVDTKEKNDIKMDVHKNVNETKEKDKTKTNETKNKKKFTILGISITRIFVYFIIYSVIGYVIETLFGLVTKGVIESRQSFLYGPFCAIYGVGAVIMILGLQYFKKNFYTLFLGGFLIGSVVEYLISLIGEWFFNIKWWDYSNMAFNINGRVCIAFSLIWGVLAIYLMGHFNPRIDKIIDKIESKIPKKILFIAVYTTIVLMFLDFVVTGFALKVFFTRLVNNYDLELANMDSIVLQGDELYEKDEVKKFTEKYFSDEKILKTFPNIKVTKADGSILVVSDVLKDIQPYYFKLFTINFNITQNNEQ